MIDARLWATGQAAALEAAREQVKAWKAEGWETAKANALVALYETGVKIAKTHFGSDDPDVLAKADYTAKAIAAAAAELAQNTGVARTELHRRILAFGVTALGSAAFGAVEVDAPDDFWDSYDVALGSEGDDFIKALKKMAEIVNAKVNQ